MKASASSSLGRDNPKASSSRFPSGSPGGPQWDQELVAVLVRVLQREVGVGVY